MKYEIQQSQKAEGCERRMVQRRAINAFIFQFRLDNHRPPSRTEIAAHFQKSPAWLDYLAKHEKEDNTPQGGCMTIVPKPVSNLGSITIVVTLDEFHRPPLTEEQQRLVRELFPKTWARGGWAKGRITNDLKEEMLNTARADLPEAYKQIEALLDGIAFEYRVKDQGPTPEKEGETH